MGVAYRKPLIVLGCVFLLSLSVGAQTWRQVGPPGGDVQSLAAVPGNTRTLYLGTSDGHVFGSINGGENWSLLGRIGEHHDDVIMSMVVDVRSASTIYATSWALGSHGGGVYRSADGGHTWQLIGLQGLVVRAIAQAASNPDIFVAGATDGVYRSEDAGKNWARISPEKHEDLRNFDSIAIDPHDPNTIFAGTYHLPWKTVDGGKNWAPVHQGMVDDSDVMSITIDQNDAAHIFASACSGIYQSPDGGANWTKFKGIPKDSRRTVHILQDPKRPMTVYAATTEGLWKTSDGGATWRVITPMSWSILSMVIDPENSDRLILGTERLGVQVSGDGGETYHASNQGFSHRRIVDAAVDPQHPERALVVLTSNFEPMLETNDAGRTWTPLATGLKSGPPRHIFASPDGWFAAPGPGGLLRYDVSKSSWLSVNQIAEVSTSAQSRRFAAAQKVSGQPGAKTPLSKAGASSAASTGTKTTAPFHAKVNDMAFGDGAWYAATEEGLLVSRDRGLNWRMVSLAPVEQPAASGSTLITASFRAVRTGQGNSYVWALTSRQLEVSGDGGKTWISRTLPFEPRGPLHLHPSDENTVVMASDHGVFISRDTGASWKQASLSELSFDDLAPVRNAVVVSTAAGTLFLSRDGGKTWGHMDGPTMDSSISASVAGSRKSISCGVRYRRPVCVGNGHGIVRVHGFDPCFAHGAAVVVLEDLVNRCFSTYRDSQRIHRDCLRTFAAAMLCARNMSALIPPGCAAMQRGDASPSQLHTLGWNARRDFFAQKWGPRTHTDERGQIQNKEN
jgi:photosystem II stability/assembly factor-like uncharacterized protein